MSVDRTGYRIDPTTATGRRLYQLAFGAVILAAWTLGGLVWPQLMPHPGLIVGALYEQTVDGPLLAALYWALTAIVTGYLLAVVVGISVGMVMGLDERLEAFFDPYLDSLYAMPIAAVIPALVMWFGTGFDIRVVVVFLFAVFPITINTLEGVRSIPPRLWDLSRSYDAGRWDTIRHVVIPYELPYIFTGLRLGGGLAVRGLVVCELLVAVTGFGRLINQWSAAFRLEGVLSVVVVLMALGVLFNWALHQLERRVVAWDISVVDET